MTLSEFVKDRQQSYEGFRRWMRERIGSGLAVVETFEVSSEGWGKLFLVWETMMDQGIPGPEIDKVLHAMVGGWYTPKEV